MLRTTQPQRSPALSPVATIRPSRSHFKPPVLDDHDSQRLLRCNRRLQDLGINDRINIPQIVTIGDQSTGKSSLIAKLSGIHVPKASGLCTKCPISISLHNTQNLALWSCKVTVEEKYFYNASAKNKKVNNAHPLGPWQALASPRSTVIAEMHDQSQLLDAIQKAEEFILTPRDENKEKISDALETFTPNIIKIDASCDSASLSFIDLPGVIQTAPTMNGRALPKYNIDIVRSLAVQYAQDPNNIMLLMLPMNHDAVNIASFGIIRDQNAQSRTLAVFTKPDRVPHEQQVQCLHQYFNQGTAQEFMGNHMVMLGEFEDMTENDFFSQAPFANTSEAIKQSFGVQNLTDGLRKILFTKIQATLPDNLRQIQRELDRVTNELKNMPAPPNATEIPYQLKEDLLRFESVVQATFGSSQQTGQALNSRGELFQCMQQFTKDIRETAPKVSCITDEDRRKINGTTMKARAQGGAAADTKTVRDEIFKLFTLDSIREINSRYVRNAMPGSIESEAVDEMIKMSVGHWKSQFQHFVQKLREIVDQHVYGAIEADFGNRAHLDLYRTLHELTQTFINDVFETESRRLELACDAEQGYPFTLDRSKMQKLEASAHKVRKEHRDAQRLRVLNASSQTETKKKGRSEPTVDDLGEDEFDTELLMAARVAAYYDLAAARFTDTICQQVHARLLPRCEKYLVPFLREELGLNDIAKNRDRIIALMTEDPEREAHRQTLQGLMRRLEEGHDFIAQSLSGSAGTALKTPSRGLRDLALSNGSGRSPAKREVEDAEDESPSKKPRSLNLLHLGSRNPSDSLDTE